MHETEKTLTHSPQWIYFFGEYPPQGDRPAKDILGGKGEGLSQMTQAGFPVQPGFTLTIDCCNYYHKHGGSWPDGLEKHLQANMIKLEAVTGKLFGKGTQPLLVSVRSGAAASMPGMMDTILNCGLNSDLQDSLTDKKRFWAVYRQYIQQFATTVAGISTSQLSTAVQQPSQLTDQTLAHQYIDLYEHRTAVKFPDDPWMALHACINAVFQSWNNDRAKIYRKAHALDHLTGTAVNIQVMYDCEVSGIAFTANPANPAENEIIIESSFGLGESVVSGDVVPDRFVLDAQTCAIKEKVIGPKDQVMLAMASNDKRESLDPSRQSLSDTQINQLAKIALKLEKHFGHPVDIEWGLAQGRFSVLQSRKIRGLDVALDVEVGRLAEIEKLKQLAASNTKIWITHNLAETLESPTPLTWDIIRSFMNGDGGFGAMYKDFGYQPSNQIRTEGFLELICGAIYVDPDRASQLFWQAMPFSYDHDQVLDDPRLLESSPMKFDASHADHAFLLRLPATLFAMVRCVRIMKLARKNAVNRFEHEILPDYLKYISKQRSRDLASLDISELINELHNRMQVVLTEFGKESLKPGFFGGCARAELEALLVQLMGQAQGSLLCQKLTSGLEGDSTIDQNIMLFDVAQANITLDTFIETYGHRANGEMELAKPRWNEDSAFIEQMLARQSTSAEYSPAAMHQANADKRLEAMANLRTTLQEYGGSFLFEKIYSLALESQQLLPYRESGKHYLLMGYQLIRDVILELGKRWELPDDIFFLHLDEFDCLADNSQAIHFKLASRRIRWQSAKRLDLPDAIDSRSLEKLGLAREIKAARELDGLALSPGIVTGTAKILRDPADTHSLDGDCILICPSTDPSWTSLFTMIKGLVVERGGMLSHGAIAARDFSIPAVACADATLSIPDGATVRVDGDSGHISVIEN